MAAEKFIILDGRGVISLAGADVRGFLQGIITNDIHKVTPEKAIYSALLTPQGKFLHDFFIAQWGEALLLDCEAARAADLVARLTRYRLRAKVDIQRLDDRFDVAAVIGDNLADAFALEAAAGAVKSFAGGTLYLDPRLAAVGLRAMLPAGEAAAALGEVGFSAGSEGAYERLRLAHGLPDGSRDIAVDEGFLLENNFEELNGVDFDKGCYVGQELTARTKHRATLRKRLFRVDVDGPLPESGALVQRGDHKAGVMRSGLDRTGLALLRLDQVRLAAEADERLQAGDARLSPSKPAWARF